MSVFQVGKFNLKLFCHHTISRFQIYLLIKINNEIMVKDEIILVKWVKIYLWKTFGKNFYDVETDFTL